MAKCRSCDGTGKMGFHQEFCYYCNGTGEDKYEEVDTRNARGGSTGTGIDWLNGSSVRDGVRSDSHDSIIDDLN